MNASGPTRTTRHAAPGSTSVVVIGAGPAGLTVANLLQAAGVDCTVLETESREFIETRPRAGFIEEWAVRALDSHGLADGLLAKAEAQSDCEFRLDGERCIFRYGELSGRRHFAYPQPLLVTDLVRAYADEAGGDIRFGVTDVGLHSMTTDTPLVSWTDPATGERLRLGCDFVLGCDGARGVTRDAIPTSHRTFSRHDLGVSWLALLAEAPPSADRVVFGLHPHGSAAHMARSPEVTRYYLQCPPGDAPADWPHERVWSELRKRLGAPRRRAADRGRSAGEAGSGHAQLHGRAHALRAAVSGR